MRKLIKPSEEELENLKKEWVHKSKVTEKRAPKEKTLREVKFISRKSEERSTVLVKLKSGDEVKGWIEYYDKSFIRVTVNNGSNKFIFKKDILYIAEIGKDKLRKFY